MQSYCQWHSLNTFIPSVVKHLLTDDFTPVVASYMHVLRKYEVLLTVLPFQVHLKQSCGAIAGVTAFTQANIRQNKIHRNFSQTIKILCEERVAFIDSKTLDLSVLHPFGCIPVLLFHVSCIRILLIPTHIHSPSVCKYECLLRTKRSDADGAFSGEG